MPGVWAQVGFCQNHHRACPAVPGKGQVALQPPEIKISVERHADKYRVNVGGNHLLRAACPCCFADKEAHSRQNSVYDGAALLQIAVDHHKIAHGGKVRGAVCLIPQPAGHLRQLLAPFTDQAIDAFLLREDPACNVVFAVLPRCRRISFRQAVCGHIHFRHGFSFLSLAAFN